MIAFKTENTLSDGSKVYDVCLRDGAKLIAEFNCVDEKSADELLDIFQNKTSNVSAE